MYSFTKREQIIIVSIILIVISIFGYKMIVEKKIEQLEEIPVLAIKSEDATNEDTRSDGTVNQTEREDLEEDKVIMIHISGQVHNPGLLELRSGDRINDAVILSGGLKNDADIDRINLSQKVQDEDKIYIPKIGEELEQIQIIESNSTSNSNFEARDENSNEKIDINTCTKESLVNLPGIGDVTAEKIIKYREEFKFQNIEDIKQVSGIGDKKFEAIKDLISVK